MFHKIRKNINLKFSNNIIQYFKDNLRNIEIIILDNKYFDGIDLILDFNSCCIFLNESNFEDEFETKMFEEISQQIFKNYLKYTYIYGIILCEKLTNNKKIINNLNNFICKKFPNKISNISFHQFIKLIFYN